MWPPPSWHVTFSDDVWWCYIYIYIYMYIYIYIQSIYIYIYIIYDMTRGHGDPIRCSHDVRWWSLSWPEQRHSWAGPGLGEVWSDVKCRKASSVSWNSLGVYIYIIYMIYMWLTDYMTIVQYMVTICCKMKSYQYIIVSTWILHIVFPLWYRFRIIDKQNVCVHRIFEVLHLGRHPWSEATLSTSSG